MFWIIFNRCTTKKCYLLLTFECFTQQHFSFFGSDGICRLVCNYTCLALLKNKCWNDSCTFKYNTTLQDQLFHNFAVWCISSKRYLSKKLTFWGHGASAILTRTSSVIKLSCLFTKLTQHNFLQMKSDLPYVPGRQLTVIKTNTVNEKFLILKPNRESTLHRTFSTIK